MISFATSDPQVERQAACDSDSFPWLMADARHGCPDARGAVCELFRPFVTRLARRMIPARLRTKVDPEDLAQDVLFDLYRCIDRFTGQEDAQVRGWLYRATTNRGRDLLRRFGPGSKRDVAREQLLLENSEEVRWRSPSHCDCPCQQAIEGELRRAIQTAIGRLAHDQRRAFELVHDGQHSYADSAKQLGRSSEAVRKLCARARAQVKCDLQTTAMLV